MGSEDFSYVLERVPGAMANLGTRPDGDGPIAPNHSNRMVLNERALATGIAVLPREPPVTSATLPSIENRFFNDFAPAKKRTRRS